MGNANPSTPEPLQLREQINQLRKQRDAHQMDEPEYVDAILSLLTSEIKKAERIAYEKGVLVGNLEGREDCAKSHKVEIERATTAAQLSILRGFRRRDFVRGDFYEMAILDRLAQLHKADQDGLK